MRLSFLFTGKTKIGYIQDGINDYFKRLQHYCKSEITIIPDIKKSSSLPVSELRKKEGEAILSRVPGKSAIVLLDEKGKTMSSSELAGYLAKKTEEGRDICMVIGGAYGFSETVYNKADDMISLSKMTFSHQMVRVILIEQVYRALTINRGEKYHHEGSVFKKRK